MKRPSWLGVWCLGVYAFLYLPMAVMFAFSFNDSRRNVIWRGFTTKWYGKLFSNTELVGALANSLELAAAATAITVTLALLASYVLVRHPSFRGRAIYRGLMNTPMMMPEVVLGVGLLTFFVRSNIILSFWTLVFSHVIFCLPYATGAITARLMSLKSSNLEQAAMDLGASEWQAFLKITLPLTWPALFSAALLAFTVSFEDFIISFFIADISTVTLPMQIYSMMKFGITPEVNALASLLLFFTAIALFAHHALSREAGER